MLLDGDLKMNSANHKVRTLWLCGILHALTHIYHVALLPLYLLIQKDLKLAAVEQTTLLVGVLMIAYYLPTDGNPEPASASS